MDPQRMGWAATYGYRSSGATAAGSALQPLALALAIALALALAFALAIVLALALHYEFRLDASLWH